MVVVNGFEYIEVKYLNTNCSGDPYSIRTSGKFSPNGYIGIIGKNEETGDTIILQTMILKPTDTKVTSYKNEMNICTVEGTVSFRFYLNETKEPLSIPINSKHEYCSTIELFEPSPTSSNINLPTTIEQQEEYNKNKLYSCNQALIVTYKNDTCKLQSSTSTYLKYLCDSYNQVHRYSCKNSCNHNDCEYDKFLPYPTKICPHFNEIQVNDLK